MGFVTRFPSVGGEFFIQALFVYKIFHLFYFI